MKWTLTLRCKECGHKYKRTIDAGERDIGEVPDPPCPKCKKARPKAVHGGLEHIVESGRAPGIVGANLAVKAIDITAQIVMEDQGHSDLRTNTRQGDTMVPQLTMRQQKMSENFWGGKRRAQPTMNVKPLVDSAMQGAYLPGRGARAHSDAVSGNEVLTSLHAARSKPATGIVASYDPRKKA